MMWTVAGVVVIAGLLIFCTVSAILSEERERRRRQREEDES
jgi:hypothetical protein